MNKKIIVLILIISIVFSIITVKADFNPEGSKIVVTDALLNDVAESASVGSNQHAFYEIDLDRWYILYSYEVSSGNFKFYYAYSDSGDKTTWNVGGACSGWTYNMNSPTNGYKMNYLGSFIYDNENDLGHLTYFDGDNWVLKYRNFTLDSETGVMSRGSEKIIFTAGAWEHHSVDIALSHNNKPIIITSYANSFQTFFCESTDGYNGNWINANFVSGFGKQSVSVIPISNVSAIFVVGNLATPEPLEYIKVDSTDYTNGSSSISLSDENSLRGQTVSGGIQWNCVSVSYNTTHGAVSYTDHSSPYKLYIILFDFETVTTIEYECSENAYASGLSINSNEFFVLFTNHQISTMDLFGIEQHNATYESYFNASATELFFENYGLADSQTMGLGCSSRMTDTQNMTLYISEDGSNMVVLFAYAEGESFPPAPNGNGEEREDPFDWGNVKYMLALVVIFIITVFAIYIKKSVR